MTYTEQYLQDAAEIIRRLDTGAIEQLAARLAQIRAQSGRVFFLGVGGGAGNCSHAVNDFRKLAAIECYAPTDNVCELTARANDDGWPSVFAGWLRVSRLSARDALFIMSVGGGDRERNISPNLVAAIELARDVGASVLGIVGRDGGYTARAADACVIVPSVNAAAVTPHTEAMQAVIWHLLVTHPLLQRSVGKWEATARRDAS
jgi:D-sedoheptulose 7-phosphate isomerase